MTPSRASTSNTRKARSSKPFRADLPTLSGRVQWGAAFLRCSLAAMGHPRARGGLSGTRVLVRLPRGGVIWSKPYGWENRHCGPGAWCPVCLRKGKRRGLYRDRARAACRLGLEPGEGVAQCVCTLCFNGSAMGHHDPVDAFGQEIVDAVPQRRAVADSDAELARDRGAGGCQQVGPGHPAAPAPAPAPSEAAPAPDPIAWESRHQIGQDHCA